MAVARPRSSSSVPGIDWRRLSRAGGGAAFIFLAYSLATMVQITVLGGPPSSAAEAFHVLQQNKAVGLLRLDFPTVLVLPFYYLLFLGLFAALKDIERTHAAIATGMIFIGLTLVLAMPTALPLMGLSERYATATSDAMRAHYLAAGEAVLATDIWHGTGAYMGGLFVQVGAVWISLIMLRGVFSKLTAYVGIITHGFDLVHVLLAPFLPGTAAIFMVIGGVGYPVWLWLVGRRLLRIGRAGGAEIVHPGP